MGNTAVIRMAHDGQGVTLAGQPMAFLVTGEHTKHTSMFDWTLPPHFSTGRHVHRVQEETFYVLEGQCEWQIGNETVRALPGTFVFIPPGVPHNIANAGNQPARVIMTVSPPSRLPRHRCGRPARHGDGYCARRPRPCWPWTSFTATARSP